MRKSLALICVLAAGACAASEPARLAAASETDVDSDLEQLYAVYHTDDGLRVRAASNGCTNEDSFDVQVQQGSGQGGGSAYVVSFVRTTPDRCSGYSGVLGEVLFFPYAEIGVPAGADVTVANPVGRPRQRI